MKQETFEKIYNEFINNNKKIAEIKGMMGFEAELYTNGLIRYFKGQPNLIMPFNTFLSMEIKKPLLGKAELFTKNFKGKKSTFMVCKDKNDADEFLNKVNLQITQNKIIGDAIKIDAITSDIANKINPKNSLADELEKSHELYKKGIITEDEFNEIKKKIING